MCRVCGLQFCGVEFVRSSLGGMGVCRHEQNEESSSSRVEIEEEELA